MVPIAQEVGWAPGPVWTGAENLASIGIRSPDRLYIATTLPGSRSVSSRCYKVSVVTCFKCLCHKSFIQICSISPENFMEESSL
jgi:hypothetical protein